MKSKFRIETFGVLASGKSTFVSRNKMLLENFELECLSENLQDLSNEIGFWLENPKRRTFFVQAAFYMYSYRHISQSGSRAVITDYSLMGHHYMYSTTLYEAGWIDHTELQLLKDLLLHLDNDLPPLKAIIYCENPLDVIRDRVGKRGRDVEEFVTLDYLELLAKNGKEYIKNSNVPVVSISSTSDFTKPLAELNEIISALEIGEQ